MKHTFICLLGICLLAAPAAAESVIITLDQPTLTGQPGQTLTFSGTLENTSGLEQFISNVLLPTDPSLSGNVSPFLINGFSFLTLFFSLPSGPPTLSFGLFDIEIPLFALPGTYTLGNEFSLVGGPSFGDAEPLGSALFTVVVEDPSAVPEPGTWGLGLLGLALIWRRRS